MPATISSFRTLKAGQSAIAPHQRASGWSVHPSNPAPTPQSSDSPGPVLPFDSLRSIASGLAWALRAVPDDNGDRATARSVRLIATSLYDIWLITWPDGATLGPHDHGGARSVLHMVEGELIETYADRSEAWPSRVRVLRSGDATCGGTSLVHDVANRSGARATSLHVYSPPLSDLTLFQRFTGGDEPAHGRTIAIPERLPRASGGDLHLVRPTPLVTGRGLPSARDRAP